MKTLTLLMPLALLATAAVGQHAEVRPVQKLNLGATVTGQFVGDFLNEKNRIRKTVGIPGVAVELRNARSGKVIQTSTTTGKGHYRFSRLAAGAYQLCWQSYEAERECGSSFILGNQLLALTPVKLTESVLPLSRIATREPSIDPGIRDYLEDLLRRSGPGCNDSAGDNRFLVRKRNDGGGDAARAERIGENYYRKVDPNNKRLTLGKWWEFNGFDPVTGRAPAENNGFNAAAVAYLNHNDLGFGRNMHCLKKNARSISCWVANHGAGDQNLNNADLAANYIAPGPTVTMEYSGLDPLIFKSDIGFRPFARSRGVQLKEPLKARDAVISQVDAQLLSPLNRDFSMAEFNTALINVPTVKFYVYAPATDDQAHADFPRTTKADLDGCGVKHTPGLCLNCHGGNVPYDIVNGNRDNWTKVDVREVGEASFREFDTATFKYPGSRQAPNNVEHAVFKRLNLLVKATNPDDAITALINGWYDNSSDITINENYVPASWKNQVGENNISSEAVYVDVVGKACRTCHVALGGSFNWDEKSNLDGYSSFLNQYVCDADMPHARITDINFTAAQRNTLLNFYGASRCN